MTGNEMLSTLGLRLNDPDSGKFTMEKMPVYHIIDEEKKREAS